MSATFTPTFLYIKRHAVTGLLYFGKTVRNPEIYKGSGKYWLRHCATHGTEHIETLWYCLFVDLDTLQDFALSFSRQQSVVEKDEWANLIEEDGVNGAPVGHQGVMFSPECLKTISEKSKASWATNREKIVSAQREAANTPERLLRYSQTSSDVWQQASDERRNWQRTHARTLFQHKSDETTHAPKTNSHKAKIAAALVGKSKTPEHVRASRIAHSKHTGQFRDHTGTVHEHVIDFLDKYQLRTSFLDTLDSPIKHTSVFEKLGIQKSTLTKRELGMDFV